jgi:NADPH-dependent 2,4-dienoyl-CoA reductase/sulfur reductase-like enzyme
MKTHYDLVIIGAGPAGLSAALEARKYNLSVIVLGEQRAPGGQVYRALERTNPEKIKILGPDYHQGRPLIRRFRDASIDYLPGALVWQVDPDLTVSILVDDNATQLHGKRILISTGARERPVPIPGWTLPGVMAATAADVLLKSHGIVPSGNVVLAGSGPLLLLTATRLIASGVSLKAVLETTPGPNVLSAVPALPRALRAYDYLLKGLTMMHQVHRSGVPIHRGVADLKILGNDAVESVRFSSGKMNREIEVDILFLHNGVVPDTQITRQLECDHQWHDLNRYWQPLVNRWGSSSLNGVGVSGDAAGIYGAGAAVASGQIAALEAAFRLNVISRPERNARAKPFKKVLDREKSIRPFLDRLYRPAKHLLVPKDEETVVCRCEEVTAGQIRNILKLGAPGPNQLKTQTRTGMGPCQGRMCELTLCEIIADHCKTDVAEVGYLRIRPPIKPITVAQLAGMTTTRQGADANDISNPAAGNP